jgi:hypothetical protein
MQRSWQQEADALPITQVTHPSIVADFIASQPGLAEVCRLYPRYLISYAPQLAIRGFGGELEEAVEDLYRRSLAAGEKARAERSRSGTALTTDGLPPRCDDEFAIRDDAFGAYTATHVACGFVQGNYVSGGPQVAYYPNLDYLAWLLSDESRWLPSRTREFLTEGIARWGNWVVDSYTHVAEEKFGFEPSEVSGTFARVVSSSRSRSTFKAGPKVRHDLIHRLDFSAQLLRLPESGEELASRVLGAPVDFYFDERLARERARSRRRRSLGG